MAYIGACPDMCPEKERQTRYTLNSMSIFERDQYNQPNVYAMVKEYRRSGADQEEPSPLDLRTPKALEITLDYLVTYIMDDSRSTTQELAGEWYDFLWDRLRAIRKDITQQNICDQASVVLVERCARFHVHSCYAMNRIKDFDLDMNKRNLNDCLQMVRQMYHDLKVSSGTVCAGELEFQKYDILLHLNEDHLSSTLLMKKSDYRSSSEMKFITQIFNAYTNNDYYKFFQLMERADYMTSCVLSLYANKMRIIGLKTVINACARRQTTFYPFDLMTTILGFDDDEDLKSFASLFGIGVQEKDAKAYLVLTIELLQILRNYESIMPPFKSKRLVTAKMQGQSVGQLVYGPNTMQEQPVGQHVYSPNTIQGQSVGQHVYSPNTMQGQSVRQHVYSPNTMQEQSVGQHVYSPNTIQEQSVGQHVYSPNTMQEQSVGQHVYGLNTIQGQSVGQLVYCPNTSQIETNVVIENDDSVEDDEAISLVEDTEAINPVEDNEVISLVEDDEAISLVEDNEALSLVEDTDATSSIEDNEATGYVSTAENDNLEVIQGENRGKSPPTPPTLPSLPNPKFSDIAREMPAGYFKVRSLSSRLPTLQLPPADQKQMVVTKRLVTEPIQRKKLKTIANEIREEKDLNQVYFKITQIFTL